MGDLRAAVAQERKVVRMRVMQERVIVEKNAMADDGILAERAGLRQPTDRCFSISPHGFLKLDDGPGRMDLDRLPAVARAASRIWPSLQVSTWAGAMKRWMRPLAWPEASSAAAIASRSRRSPRAKSRS